MIASLLLTCYVLLTAYTSGLSLLCLPGFRKQESNIVLHPALMALGGLCLLSLLLQLLHFVMPVNEWSQLLIWSFNGAVCISSRSFFAQQFAALRATLFPHAAAPWLLLAFLLAAALNVSAKPGTGDIADYHLQMIRWIESYPVVPGLGNLRRQLGNNSNWFLLNAFFGMRFTGMHSLYTLNAALLLIAASYFIPARNDRFFFFKTLVLLFIACTAFRKYVGAVTNDYAVTIFTLIILSEAAKLAGRQYKHPSSIALLTLLILTVITFKLSALPLLLLLPWILFRNNPQQGISLKPLLLTAGLGILIWLPWLITNVLQSGYLCYPVSSPDLFAVDWKMRKEILEWETVYNLTNARIPGTRVDEVINLPFSAWFPQWIGSTDLFSLSLIAGFLICSVLVALLLLSRKTGLYASIRDNGGFYVLTVLYIALLLWFTHGPAPRFVFGYLVFGLAFYAQCLLLIFPSWLQKLQALTGRFYAGALLLLLLATAALFVRSNFSGASARLLLLPKDYPEVHYNDVSIGGTIIHVPWQDEQCWDMPIPCTSVHDPALQLRGNSPREGFRIDAAKPGADAY